MKSLRSKASRFFRDSPTPDEKAAIADSSDVDFDADIGGADIRKKREQPIYRIPFEALTQVASRLFGRKCDRASKLDKPLPAPPLNSSTSTLLTPVTGQVTVRGHQGELFDDLPDYEEEEDSLQFSSAPRECATSPEPTATVASERPVGDDEVAPKLKPQGSFAALKSKGSRLFRCKNSNSNNSAPLPPPVPQIPIDLPGPKAHIPVLTPARNSRSSLANNSRTSLTRSKDRSTSNPHQERIISISRPTLMAQIANPRVPENPIIVPFTKRAGPPPPRPARPESLDEETLTFMRESGTRMVLPSTPRASISTGTASTPRSQTSSIEARLGFPSGFGTTSRSCSLESPLAAQFSGLRLPVRDSSGSVRYSRFSEYVKYGKGIGADGVEAEDRELGPIEMYRKSKEGDWVLEKRVPRKDGGQGGMLFRDRWGGFHFVADI